MIKNITIGITGGIGSGKSVVARVLRCNGFYVYDCDMRAKFLMTHDSELKQKLQDRLGSEIYFANGDLNRDLLASKLFSSDEIRGFVNGVVHKAVRDDIKSCRGKNPGWFFIESAILVTGGIEKMCNQVWLVEAPAANRIKRVLKRDSTSREALEMRIESQKQEVSLLDKSKTIILNNNEHSPLLIETLKLTNKFFKNQTYSMSC